MAFSISLARHLGHTRMDVPRGIELARETAAAGRAALGDTHPRTIEALHVPGQVLEPIDPAEAEVHLRAAAEAGAVAFGGRDWLVLIMRGEAGRAAGKAGRLAEGAPAPQLEGPHRRRCSATVHDRRQPDGDEG